LQSHCVCSIIAKIADRVFISTALQIKKHCNLITVYSIHMNFIKKSLSSTIILLVFLIAVNVLALQKPLYLDLTEEKIYTISEASKEILRNLDRDINVNLYISKDLPVDLINVKTQL